MKVNIIRTDEPGQRYLDADTGLLAPDDKQASEPVRLLPAGNELKPVGEEDLKFLKKILAASHDLKLKHLPNFLGTSEIETAAMITHGDAHILSYYTERKTAERHAIWAEREAKRQGSLKFWVFRNKVVKVEGWEVASREEVVTRVVHKVLSEEKAFDKMKAEIERFRIMDRGSAATREPIPEDVRIFVWRRDQAKCAKCGSQDKLEFDHIIPIEKGGNNTTRNVQILCERCNRTKGASI
ncbi:MAG: HNH endonuclease [Vicinamibacterales bacterium]